MLQTTADWAKKLRAKPREVWRSPPHLSDRGAHLWWELISTSGLAASTTGTKPQALRKRSPFLGPGDFGEVQLDLLRSIPEDPTDVQLIGMLSRVRKARPQGPMYHARSVLAWHASALWGAFKLADAICAASAKTSKIGAGAAEAAPLLGATAQDTEALAPRSKLLKVSGHAASAEDFSTLAHLGA